MHNDVVRNEREELPSSEYHDLEQFCLSVVKRDRSDFFRHPFKLSANTVDKAFAVIRPLVEKVSKHDCEHSTDFRFLIHVLSGTVDSEELRPFFGSVNIPLKICGVALYSKACRNSVDTSGSL
ncbi:unnamed protein product [Heligmosomoides polygyrus]|uniref:THUMP domain-containing protein n=1 Tax=Heligmosomoides polygyrus TaxID=6339 RepID=A0A183FSZ2_HELPZ|nr:unnamed protein product [Heligmosomoides polygyrus]